MAKSTKVVFAKGLKLVDKEDEISSKKAEASKEIVTIHGRSTIEVNDPHLVRRVKVSRDAEGNLFLELEE